MRKCVLAVIGASVLMLAPAAIAAQSGTATWPVVKQRAAGTRVRTVQYLLLQRGVRVAPDGTFGPETTAAVKKFQRANKLVVDGHVGPATWMKLVLSIKSGSRGDAVRAAQNQLRNQWGYKTVTVDGTFGTATQKAVKAFQTKNKLAADGIVGQATWKALVGS
jgi:zinc D-Ala-D-Ala carboxypeptidase